MRKSLGTLAILVILFGVIGSSRNWFSWERNQEGPNTEVRVKFDRAKIRADTQHAAEMARELGDNLEKKIKER